MFNVQYQKMIYREDLQANPDTIYVFGDNEKREGLGGQAKEMRGEPNAFGIPTCKAPGIPYTDDDVDKFLASFSVSMIKLQLKHNLGHKIVWPLDGIGTGLAIMPEHFLTRMNEFLSNIGVKNG